MRAISVLDFMVPGCLKIRPLAALYWLYYNNNIFGRSFSNEVFFHFRKYVENHDHGWRQLYYFGGLRLPTTPRVFLQIQQEIGSPL